MIDKMLDEKKQAKYYGTKKRGTKISIQKRKKSRGTK